MAVGKPPCCGFTGEERPTWACQFSLEFAGGLPAPGVGATPEITVEALFRQAAGDPQMLEDRISSPASALAAYPIILVAKPLRPDPFPQLEQVFDQGRLTAILAALGLDETSRRAGRRDPQRRPKDAPLAGPGAAFRSATAATR